eukprot:944444-Rhodomonas_salina.1
MFPASAGPVATLLRKRHPLEQHKKYSDSAAAGIRTLAAVGFLRRNFPVITASSPLEHSSENLLCLRSFCSHGASTTLHCEIDHDVIDESSGSDHQA